MVDIVRGAKKKKKEKNLPVLKIKNTDTNIKQITRCLIECGVKMWHVKQDSEPFFTVLTTPYRVCSGDTHIKPFSSTTSSVSGRLYKDTVFSMQMLAHQAGTALNVKTKG